jgi:hypothetical protein
MPSLFRSISTVQLLVGVPGGGLFGTNAKVGEVTGTPVTGAVEESAESDGESADAGWVTEEVTGFDGDAPSPSHENEPLLL